ncbi:MAG TPA: CD1871A family CXXC motif-containing protein [Candidatus Limnocylindria bacterium]|nr:CD1871A family CXXC motif-containing protein [Candidatus Limnocylindria bacterium]
MPRRRADLRWLVIFVLGAVLLVGGVWRGEALVVLRKAVRVCLECIGIG